MKLILFTLAMLAASWIAQAQIVTNGNFEVPDVTTYYWSEPPPWHFKGVANLQIRDNAVGAGTAQSGSQFFAFDDMQSPTAGLYQDISNFVPGQIYTVSYWVSARAVKGSEFYGNWSVTASIAGVTNQYTNYIPISSTHDSNPGSTYSAWVNRQLLFTATAETHRLTFDGTGYHLYQSGSGSIPALDNVSISRRLMAQFDKVSLSGDYLLFSGFGGPPGSAYTVLTAASPTASINAWTPVRAGAFTADGTFEFYVPFSGVGSQAYFRLSYVQ